MPLGDEGRFLAFLFCRLLLMMTEFNQLFSSRQFMYSHYQEANLELLCEFIVS